MKFYHVFLLLVSALVGGAISAWLVLQNVIPQPETTQGVAVEELVAAPDQPQPISYASAVAVAENAVVNIYTSASLNRSEQNQDDKLEGFFDHSNPQASGIGSGVIISASGFIITNYHVIRHAKHIYIGSPRKRNAVATVIGTDPETDLALLQAELDNPQPITFADSDTLQNGDVVLAIGNPFGVGKTVTMGIVSALGRKDVGINTYEQFIQTDAAINPGNSGGALINTNGKLVGINTAIASNSGFSRGIAFAVPANQVKTIIDLLQTYGRIVRGWLGVSLHTAYIEKDGRDYAEIVGLFKDGPAEAAGLAAGDLILKINGLDVADASDAINFIAQVIPGNTIDMLISRDNTLRNISATSTARPSLAE